LLREAVPKASRVAILGRPLASSPVQAMEHAARSLDVRLQLVAIDQAGQLDRGFAEMTAQNAAALIVTPSPFNLAHRERIVSLAAKHRLPGMYGLTAFVDAGGLMAYGASLRDLYRRAATYVDKILKGAKPADLPVEQATKFELVINLKTARALDLVIPPSLRGRADRVIEWRGAPRRARLSSGRCGSARTPRRTRSAAASGSARRPRRATVRCRTPSRP